MDRKEKVPDKSIGPLVDHPEYVTPTRILSRPDEKTARVAKITSRSDKDNVKDENIQDESYKSILGDSEKVSLPTISTAIAAIEVGEGDDQVKNVIDDPVNVPIWATLESSYLLIWR